MLKKCFYIFDWSDLPDPLKDNLAADMQISNDSLYKIYNEGETEGLSEWLEEQGVPVGAECLMEVCW